ncbi:hypothetical protein PUG81_08240 [Erwiniaceae bacterium L1_54_6]|nr:hypothetical protein [Erwiniaceae bacterium L1_54_6]
MKNDIRTETLSGNHSIFTQTVSHCNFAMETIRKITNVPCQPISRVIYNHLNPLLEYITPESKLDADYFRNNVYPYRHHLYIEIALKIMKQPEVNTLLENLYSGERHCVERFLALSGLEQGQPGQVNLDVFAQLVAMLERGGALGKPGALAGSPFHVIPRNTVLLNFFSAFIPARLITLPALNQGIKSVLTAAISQIYPSVGNFMRAIDSFNPVTTLFPHRTNNLTRQIREEMMGYHIKRQAIQQKMVSLYNLRPWKVDDGKSYAKQNDVSSSSLTNVNTPLMVGATVVTLIQQPQSYVKSLTAVALLSLTGGVIIYRYMFPSQDGDYGVAHHNNTNIIHDVSYGDNFISFGLVKTVGGNRTCYDIVSDMKEMMQSDETGLRLVNKFCHYFFDEHCDLNTRHTDALLKKWNIHSFSSTDRTEMSVLLTHILSVLLTRPGEKSIFDINDLIFSTSVEVNQIWLKNIGKVNQETIKEALKQLRQFISKSLVKAFGTIDLSKTIKLSNFIILVCAPDLIQFENHNKSDLAIVSKEIYYYWNYLGKQYSDNKYVRHDDFDIALSEGKLDGFYLRRRKFYDNISKIAPLRELFENFTSSINQEFIAYHEKDVQLERLIFLTFDDIIESAYQDKGINVALPIDFDSESLRIHLPPYRDPYYKYLRGCKNLRDVIRSFPDGLHILWERLPHLIPEALRNYISDDTSAFVLKSYPKRDELKSKYDTIYLRTHNKHMDLYKSIVSMAFDILSTDEMNFLNSSLVEISAIRLENKRMQLFRYMFMPKSFRFDANTILKVAYNLRKYSEKGKIFCATHTQTKEKRFFAINIEASRINRQLPIIRLAINKTEEITGLSNEFLEGHFVFHDGKPFWDPCDAEPDFKESWLSPPEKARQFIDERALYTKVKWCEFTRPQNKIVAFFTEEKLGRSAQAITSLQKEIVEARIEFLDYERERINNTTATEKERDIEKGNWQLFVEKLPGYNCLELLDDLVIKKEDVALTSVLESLFQGMICASDVYLMSSMIKTLKGLEYSIKKVFIQKMNKKLHLELLRENLHQATRDQSSALEKTIREIGNDLTSIDAELKVTYNKIATTLAGLAGKPSEISFPIFGFKNSKTFLFPWGAGIAKKEIKTIASNLKHHVFYPWIKPQAKELLENESHLLSTPEKMNITCHSADYLALNSTANIFDIHANAPDLYRKIFFATLKKPEVQVVTDSAENGGWKLFHDYDKMAMFCFISFIIPVWSYVGKIIELDDYYNLSPNRNALSAEMLFDYLSENINQTDAIPGRLTTSDQNLLLGQAKKAIKNTLDSNIQAFEFNYLFTLKHILMSENAELLLQSIKETGKSKRNTHNKILENIKYLLDKATLYATRSAIQDKFHSAIIHHLTHYIEQQIQTQPAAITLFSPDIETFRHRSSEYSHLHPDAVLPSLAEFIRTDFRLENDIAHIYQSFARIEYSAKVLSHYAVDEWLSVRAQNDWLFAIHEYLSPQMRNQDLKPWLAEVTKKVKSGWQQELHATTLTGGLKIIIHDVINPVFISLVKEAIGECCSSYPHLLLSQYYQVDEGRWFTFLTNDFISEAHHRSRRQVYREHPFYALSDTKDVSLINAITAPYRQQQPQLTQNMTQLYQLNLASVLQNFVYFSSLPFHDRITGYVFFTPSTIEMDRNDALLMINTLINDNGIILTDQLAVLQRHLPDEITLDADRTLQLLSDIFGMYWPAAPDLYDFTFRQLQAALNSPLVTLKNLANKDFINTLSPDFTQRYQQILNLGQGLPSQALQRYMTAAIRHQLAFTNALTHVDRYLADTVLKDPLAQQLCLGAIIAHQLQFKDCSHHKLLKLANLALQDTGLIPSPRQIALLNVPGRHAAEDALSYLAGSLEHAAKMQTHLRACLNDSQQLAGFITELSFNDLSPAQHQQLLKLTVNAVQSHHRLLTFTLPNYLDQRFKQARNQGKLQFTWYLSTRRNNNQVVSVVGVGFDILHQDEGLIFPYGLPLATTGMVRQKPTSLTDATLTAICFASEATSHFTLKHSKVTAQAGYRDDESTVTTFSNWMTAAARNQLQQLSQAKNETDFVRQKNLIEQWLRQHLPFYGVDSDPLEQLQSERINALATHPDVSQWKTRNLLKPESLSSVDHFRHAIIRVLGNYTDWPADAMTLTTRRAINPTIPANQLPQQGFRGVWWDPMSDTYYLGFSHANNPILYASLAANRDVFYPLTTRAAHTKIWASLSLRETLQDDVAALRTGQRPPHIFFSQSVPAAWLQAHGNTTSLWRRVNKQVACQLIHKGTFSPESYLQHVATQNTPSSQLTPYTLQFHNGNMVFIFSEDNYQKASYHIIDAKGELLRLPDGFNDWPDRIHAPDQHSSASLFNTTIESFLAHEQDKLLPTFSPLLNEQQQQQKRSSLLRGQTSRREHIRLLSNITMGIPFRYVANPDGLIDIEVYLKRHGRSLKDELQKRTGNEVELNDQNWDIFSWREDDLYDESICNNTLKKISDKQALFNALNLLVTQDPFLSLNRTPALKTWLEDSITYLKRAIDAIMWLMSPGHRFSPSEVESSQLHQDHLAINHFLSDYDAQPYLTPEFFSQPWKYRFDLRPSAIKYRDWQRAINQLNVLTKQFPDDYRVPDRFLSLPENLWQVEQMQTYASEFRKHLNGSLNYWQQTRQANQFVIIRPETSSLPDRPISLMLTAGTGPLSNREKASPMLLSPEQFIDLMLVNPCSPCNNSAEIRLAGINSEPQTPQDFAAWAKNRFAGPVFMNELSGPAFLIRLQQRINSVMATEAHRWTAEERNFYALPSTGQFLLMNDVAGPNKNHCLAFFTSLFASDLLVTRLIMPDPEMVFGLLCEHFITVHPERAEENITMAWFLFKETFKATLDADITQSPWLIGV